MMKKMARYDDNWIMNILFFIVVCLYMEFSIVNAINEDNETLTACQHLHRAESRRAKSLESFGEKVRVPKCSRFGEFERIQCSNEINGKECWCVDEYGIELIGTRKSDIKDMNCDDEPSSLCPASSCRMYCPAGFTRDARSGCHICQCRDPCEGIMCPGGLACQPQDVKCSKEPCPPVPTCKKPRTLNDLCPAGQPLTITDTIRPFLCGNDAGKPICPPLYKCLVQSGNDYGVCCPTSISFTKPGDCPKPDDVMVSESAGVMCGTPCTNDLECPQMQKCCQNTGCGGNCKQPYNVTTCHQARMLSEILSVNEREGRGYIPQCDGPSGGFSSRQCSRNGLVCWCVDTFTGHKLPGTMGAATMVNCDGLENVIGGTGPGTGRSQGRSVDMTQKCDKNICAAVCEYGFKNDHIGCPTCECSEPCEGFMCPMGSHCEVAKDPNCNSGSSLCYSEPVCKPDLVYSNPCDIGTPLADNFTGEIFYCYKDMSRNREYQARSFFDSDIPDDEGSARSMTNYIMCPRNYKCTKLHKQNQNVCCPKMQESIDPIVDDVDRQQTMCEYLRDFSERMEGTEDGMNLALSPPVCDRDGNYKAAQCINKKIHVLRTEQKQMLEENNIRQMKMLLDESVSRAKRQAPSSECPLYKCRPCEHGFKYNKYGCQDGCTCLDQPKLPCPVYRCKGCPNGYEYDERGCMTCKCLYEDGEVSTITKRDTESKQEILKLHKIDDDENINLTKIKTSSTAKRNNEQTLNNENLLTYLKKNVLSQPINEEAMYMAEIISRRLLNQDIESRSAKLIDFSGGLQRIDKDNLNSKYTKLITKDPTPEISADENDDTVEIEIKECWCVDGFGTEIPASRGVNVTQSTCQRLRNRLECLDITCRMGCDYGFILDPETKCPTCECRDPCDSVMCPDDHECRSVEVSCEGEYCPPVPACLPKKPGQCPFLVPPGTEGSDIDVCEYDCRSDMHCDGTKRCCSNGCGTQCVEPQLKTACQHLQAIQLHQATELGVPAKQKYIAQCSEHDGSWKLIQCGPGNMCWCVDESGNELSGTRTHNKKPNCAKDAGNQCATYKCLPCEHGYVIDSNGCRTCECRDPCNDIKCPIDEECKLVTVECVNLPCPKMPICYPKRDSVCPEGNPLIINEREISCGPQNDAEICPTTHTCQLDVLTNKGVCCGKTRDVCFESLDSNCIDQQKNDTEITTRWKFSPKQNKCIPFKVSKLCQNKNVFQTEAACNSVCPVLTQCERLRLRNSLAAKRSGQIAWFQPICDPITGLWSPVQCLGRSIDMLAMEDHSNNNNVGASRAFSIDQPTVNQLQNGGVCWCADKKGAPIKDSLTRGTEPICNHRQARRRMTEYNNNDNNIIKDSFVEELIRQMTIMSDEENAIEYEDVQPINSEYKIEEYLAQTTNVEEDDQLSATTDKQNLEILNSKFENENILSLHKSTKKLIITKSRCHSMQQTASFNVACDVNGTFMPTQCNSDVCWCVDEAGNQLPLSNTFNIKSMKKCTFTPIDLVSIELHLINSKRIEFKNVYDILKLELITILGDIPDNLRVHENIDGSVYLKFDLIDTNKIDTAFAIEEMVKQNNFYLADGNLKPDITLSRFIHHNANLPIPLSSSGGGGGGGGGGVGGNTVGAAGTINSAGIPENTFQTIIFILATTSAFLISIFVVFVMLKRGKSKMKNYNINKTVGMGDKFLDYSSPIFVLSTNEKEKTSHIEN